MWMIPAPVGSILRKQEGERELLLLENLTRMRNEGVSDSCSVKDTSLKNGLRAWRLRKKLLDSQTGIASHKPKYANLTTVNGEVFLRGACGIALVSLAEMKNQSEDRDSLRKMLEVTGAKRRDDVSDCKYHMT